MVLIFTIATVAAAAIKSYNRLPVETARGLVASITQHTSVMLAITTAVQWIMVGLQGLARLSALPTGGMAGSTIRVGRPASEE